MSFTVSKLGTMLTNLEAVVEETKKQLSDINGKLDRIINECSIQRDKIVELCATAQRQAVKMNHLEQHSRNECIRITGLKLDKEKSKSNHFVKTAAYESVLKPLLNLAVTDKGDDLEQVPDLHSLVKNAHILPKPKSADSSSPHPILLRLNAVDLRGKLFKFKKAFISSNKDLNFFEDLTIVNTKALQSMRDRESVDRAWTRQGTILYTETRDKSDPKKIHRLKDPFSVLSLEDRRKLNLCYPSDLNPEAKVSTDDADSSDVE